MTENKNILKGNKHAELHTVRNKEFYAVIETKKKVKDKFTGKETTRTTTTIESAVGTRIEAKNELEAVAKENGGTVAYFGGFVN
ncbi:hypothetical protein [Priestia megaterium]|uniref:hypothetical protein n=1 Tax=Priestia megaterium TaxID=1404 RepID=UPI000BFC70AD|nr:hypothetical protein [Priestia megaterium]PGO60614.1 hypothetical protein CN981_08680 [Priestia megaterium]